MHAGIVKIVFKLKNKIILVTKKLKKKNHFNFIFPIFSLSQNGNISCPIEIRGKN